MTPLRVGDRWPSDPRKLNLRPYNGFQSDLEALTKVRNATLQATTRPEDYSELGPTDMARYYNRPGFRLEGNCWLMYLDDEPVAAAIIYPRAAFHDAPAGNFHLYVVPGLWKHGLGSRLLAHLEQAALGRGYPVLETTVAREDDKSTHFLLNQGFEVIGHSLHLALLGLRDTDAPKLPLGFTIRSLAEMDESPELYMQTANRLGAHDPNYTLITPEELAHQLDSRVWDAGGILFLLDPAGRIVGLIRASRSEPTRAYLNEVRLEPALRGKGFGTALVNAALAYLAALGVKLVELDATSENTAARNLALRAGFQETRHWLHYLKRLL